MNDLFLGRLKLVLNGLHKLGQLFLTQVQLRFVLEELQHVILVSIDEPIFHFFTHRIVGIFQGYIILGQFWQKRDSLDGCLDWVHVVFS